MYQLFNNEVYFPNKEAKIKLHDKLFVCLCICLSARTCTVDFCKLIDDFEFIFFFSFSVLNNEHN